MPDDELDAMLAFIQQEKEHFDALIAPILEEERTRLEQLLEEIIDEEFRA